MLEPIIIAAIAGAGLALFILLVKRIIAGLLLTHIIETVEEPITIESVARNDSYYTMIHLFEED